MQDYKFVCVAVTICATEVDQKLDFYILTPVILKSRPNWGEFGSWCTYATCTCSANLVTNKIPRLSPDQINSPPFQFSGNHVTEACHFRSLTYLTPVACELAVMATAGSDTTVPDAVVTWSVESMTHPTCPSTGGFSLYRVFRLHGVCIQMTHYHPLQLDNIIRLRRSRSAAAYSR